MTERNETAKQRTREYLLMGYSYERICQEIDIDPRTIKRWLNDKKFVNELREDSKIIHNKAILKAIAAHEKAYDTILDIMDSGTDRNRLAAAKMIIDATAIHLQISQCEKDILSEMEEFFNRK
jgi:hypothetical protein